MADPFAAARPGREGQGISGEQIAIEHVRLPQGIPDA